MFKQIALGVFILILGICSFNKNAQNIFWDVSQNKLNSLTPDTQKLLKKLDSPLTIQAYSPNMNMLNACQSLLAPYQRYSKLVKIQLHNTILDPSQSSKLKVTSEHTIVLTYKDRQHAMDARPADLTEAKLSNLIQQVLRVNHRWLVFLSGHQEIDFADQSALGLSKFSQMFREQGMHIGQLNLAQQQQIPHNTDLLIVANPQIELTVTERKLIHDYIHNGGKILWLSEPEAQATKFLSEEFGVELAKGVAIDPGSSKLGSPHPALKILHIKDLEGLTIFPWSGHLKIANNNQWHAEPFIQTAADSWTYTGSAVSQDLNVLYKHRGQKGPLNIGISLSRNTGTKPEQSALIIADSSFLTNKYLGLYANSQLANMLLNRLEPSETLLLFKHTPVRDLAYQPTNFSRILHNYGFTLLLPLLIIGLGLRLRTG